MSTVDIELLPKQMDFLTATDRELLYSGAFGAGKSRCLAVKLLCRASRPGTREGLCRKHLVTLKATTLKTLLESDGELPPVLPSGYYTHNKSEKTIRIRGDGEIVYFGLDDPDKIGSYNLSGVAVDQAEELAEEDWTQLRGRIRLRVEGIPNQIYAACNPGSPSHFLAVRFGLAEGHSVKRGCRAITTCSADNVFLPDEYLNDLNSFVGLAKQRYVDGKWVGSDGLVYDRWVRGTFVKSYCTQWKRVIVGCDDGYTNPAVMLVICEDNDGRLHIAYEYYMSKQLEPAVVTEARGLNVRFKPEAFVVDPSAAKLRASLSEAGLPVVEANNEVFSGIQAVQQRLVVAGDGEPRLTVSPTCINTIREFETYEWKPGKDEPIKQFDHAMDALRYGIRYFDSPPFAFKVVTACAAKKDPPNVWNETGVWR